MPLTYDSVHWAEVVNLIKVRLVGSSSVCFSIWQSWGVHDSNFVCDQCARG